MRDPLVLEIERAQQECEGELNDNGHRGENDTTLPPGLQCDHFRDSDVDDEWILAEAVNGDEPRLGIEVARRAINSLSVIDDAIPLGLRRHALAGTLDHVGVPQQHDAVLAQQQQGLSGN